MDIANTHEYIGLTDKLIQLSKDYAEARNKASEAKIALDYIFASKFAELRAKKSNIGYETGLVMLMEDGDEEIKRYYGEYIRETNKYKGLERIIDATRTKVSLFQSLVKWEGQNT